jgi:charged multivesicular body protein 2A
MGDAMKGVTKAMAQMNRQLNLPGLQKIMQEFERQNERMEMVSEVMGDAIDDALEGDEEEEETEELVNQVLDEIGIDINQEVRYYGSLSSCECTLEVRMWIGLLLNAPPLI